MSIARSLLARWPAVAFLASAAMLASAHAFEAFGRLTPCPLCLRQRDAYWAAMAIAAAAMLARRLKRQRLDRPLLMLLAFAFLTGAIVATWHAGGEWGFWTLRCEALRGSDLNAADLAAALEGRGPTVVPCDKALWRFLGVSMAGWNALVSLGLSILTVLAAFRGAPRRG